MYEDLSGKAARVLHVIRDGGDTSVPGIMRELKLLRRQTVTDDIAELKKKGYVTKKGNSYVVTPLRGNNFNRDNNTDELINTYLDTLFELYPDNIKLNLIKSNLISLINREDKNNAFPVSNPTHFPCLCENCVNERQRISRVSQTEVTENPCVPDEEGNTIQRISRVSSEEENEIQRVSCVSPEELLRKVIRGWKAVFPKAVVLSNRQAETYLEIAGGDDSLLQSEFNRIKKAIGDRKIDNLFGYVKTSLAPRERDLLDVKNTKTSDYTSQQLTPSDSSEVDKVSQQYRILNRVDKNSNEEYTDPTELPPPSEELLRQADEDKAYFQKLKEEKGWCE